MATSSASDPDATNDTTSITSTVAKSADLSVTKTLASPASPVVGDTLVYVVTTSNAGPSDLTDVTVADTLPSGVTFVDASNSGSEASGVVTWSAYSLTNGSSRVDTVRVVAPLDGSLRNAVVASSAESDPSATNDTTSITTTVGARADLTVAKSLVAPAAAVTLDTLVYQLVTSNAGPSTASDVALVDSLPASGTFVDATNGGTASGGEVTWSTFSLASGASRTDTVRVVASVDATYVNVAKVSSSADDPDSSGDRSQTVTGVPAAADLGTTKVLASPASPVAGDTLKYAVTWTNQGPSDIPTVTALDSLPAGLTFVDATNSGTESSGVVSWPGFSLASGSSRIDTVRVVAALDGSYQNVARATSPYDDGDSSDDRGVVSTTVDAVGGPGDREDAGESGEPAGR